MAEGAGTTLRNVDGSAEIELSNACYPLPNVKAGKASKVSIHAGGLDWDHDGSGMWTGPFELRG